MAEPKKSEVDEAVAKAQKLAEWEEPEGWLAGRHKKKAPLLRGAFSVYPLHCEESGDLVPSTTTPRVSTAAWNPPHRGGSASAGA